MEKRLVELSQSSKFIWRIPNFSKLETKEHYTDTFNVGDCQWRLAIYPKGYKAVDYLSMYLYSAEDSANKLFYVEFSLAVVNQLNSKNTVTKDSKRHFTKEIGVGFNRFMPLSELSDPGKGYLPNDTCIVTVEISACKLLMQNSTDDSIEVSEPKPEKQTKLDGKTTDEPVVILQGSPAKVRLVEYPGAGQPFEGGGRNHDHHPSVVVFDDEKFEDIGGFSVLKTQASLYKQIWLKYGHIATSQVPTASSYIGQVWLVADIMGSLLDMHQCGLLDVSSEMIDLWENKIQMAEKLEFNICWLREQFEIVKKCFSEIEKFMKFKTSLLEF